MLKSFRIEENNIQVLEIRTTDWCVSFVICIVNLLPLKKVE
jgi:hypothetical protein